MENYSELKNSLSAISIKALNYSNRLRLANNLDSKQPLPSDKGICRDYRGLAELIGFQFNEIKKIEEFENRTEKILDSWGTRRGATLDKLITFLEDMGRHDIIEDLTPSLMKDVENYKQYQKSLEKESPIQVAEVSSGPVNLHSRTGAITRDDLHNGECTLYDAYVSYADEDTHIAKQFADILESPEIGLKLCIRGRDKLAGCRELDSDVELIKNRCRHMLIILTENFIKSPALEFQVSFASTLAIEQKQRILIPVIWQPCKIPDMLNSVSKIDFTKEYTHGWMIDKLVTSLMPEDKIFLPSTSRSNLSSIKNASPNPAFSISTENRPVITFPQSAKYSVNSAVQIHSNALLSIAPPSDIPNEDSGTCSEMHQSAACSEMHQSVVGSQIHQPVICSEIHQSAACSDIKEVTPTPKHGSSSKRNFSIFSILKRKEKSTNTSSTSFSSGATSGFHSQSCSNIKSFENANDCTEDTSI